MSKSIASKRGVKPVVPVFLFICAAAVPVAVFSFAAGASGGSEERPADAGVEQAKTTSTGGCGLAKKGASARHVASILEEAGIKNVRVHSRESTLTVVTGDTLRCLLMFGPSGFESEIRFDDSLSAWARPEKYAVGMMKNRHIFVTAEDFMFALQGGEPALGVFMISREGVKLNTFRVDISKAAEINGGYIDPVLIEKHDLNQVVLHAKDADGNDWPRAYVFDGATGKLKGELDWEKAKAASGK